jgi:hypothetical protein
MTAVVFSSTGNFGHLLGSKCKNPGPVVHIGMLMTS